MSFSMKHLVLPGILALALATPLTSQSAEDNTQQSAPGAATKATDDNLTLAPTKLTIAELNRHRFQVSGLGFTIVDFNEYVAVVWAFSTYHSAGVAGITVKVENNSKDFLSFSPAKLIFIGSDGNQATVAEEEFSNRKRLATETQLAPGGRFESKYLLTAGVSLPARIYYEQKLLAEISK
jgi:hypothetical protein